MILVALGSNLACAALTPEETIRRAIGALGRIGRRVTASRLYRSPAWPDPLDPAFVNAVAAIETVLCPEGLLAALNGIEAGFMRRRGRRNGPRTLDLDLLDHDGRIWLPTSVCPLLLPHPRIAERDFVLLPLRDVAPDWRHPVTGRSVDQMVAALPGLAAVPI